MTITHCSSIGRILDLCLGEGTFKSDSRNNKQRWSNFVCLFMKDVLDAWRSTESWTWQPWKEVLDPMPTSTVKRKNSDDASFATLVTNV